MLGSFNMRRLEEVTVEVIQKCNLNCIFCSSFSTIKSENEIPLDLLINISKFAKEKGAVGINISGGEPLLKNDLIDYIHFNNMLNLESNIYTSGTVNCEKLLGGVEDYGIDKNLIKFIFNYQSSNPEVFNRIVGTNTFNVENINNNIKLILSRGYKVEAHIVPNKINLPNIEKTVSFLRDVGVNRVSFLRLVLQGRAKYNKESLQLDEKTDLINFLNFIKTKYSDNNFSVRLGTPFSRRNEINGKTFCAAGFCKLIIRYDGVVFPCEAFKEAFNNHLYVLGNIFQEKLETIWNNHYALSNIKRLSKYSTLANEICPAQLLYSNSI